MTNTPGKKPATTKTRPAREPEFPVPKDFSLTPWMEAARGELEAGVKVMEGKPGFMRQMHDMLRFEQKMRAVDDQIAEGLKLKMDEPADLSSRLGFDFSKKPAKPGRPSVSGLLNPTQRTPLPKLRDPLDTLGKELPMWDVAEQNREIGKYFYDLKTDPVHSGGKAYDISHARLDKDKKGNEVGKINAWCAAFVNWCLKQGCVPPLNYATADSWLKYGLSVAYPVYGCIVVIYPQGETGGGTGHVAFFVKHRGDKFGLLGGNQSRKVSVSYAYGPCDVQPSGYRWPTSVHDYLAVAEQVGRAMSCQPK